MVGGTWQSFTLTKDDTTSDRDLLRLKSSDVIKIEGYVPHELMAVALVVEYEVGIPSQQRTQNNAQTILQSAGATGKSTISVGLGVAVYIPFDGEGVVMRNNTSSGQRDLTPRDFEDRDREFDELAVTTNLRGNDAWKVLAPKAVFADLRGINDAQDENAQPKRRIGRVAKTRKSSDDADDADENETGNDDDGLDAGGHEMCTVGFDLAVKDTISRRLICQDFWVPGTGSDLAKHREKDDADEDAASADSDRDSRRRAVRRPSIRESSDTVRDDDVRDRRQRHHALSVSESIVGGDSESSNLLLDPHLYSNRFGGRGAAMDKGGRSADRYGEDCGTVDAQFSIPRDRNSLLAQSLQARLLDRTVSSIGHGIGAAHEGVTDDYDSREQGRGPLSGDGRHRAQMSTVRMQGGVVTSRPSTAPESSSSHTRNLSRAARTRLNSHGFEGALMDSYGHSVRGSRSSQKPTSSSGSGGGIHVDVETEANDELSMHDVTMQFAGYRVGPTGTAEEADGISIASYPHPRSVYFSYQFYACQATRTEVMRLLPSERGGVSVLCRAEAHARDEAPLSLRYLVDCSDGSPTEAFEFADYLAHSSLFVDVWDADSLMLIGTCSVPLRRVMRQGQTLARCAIECDIIDAESNGRVVGGVATSVITEGCAASGAVVGSVHLIISNRGDRGKKRDAGHPQLESSARASSVAGLNWRAHTDGIRGGTNAGSGALPADADHKSRSRPKITVRARPLSENAPELSQALQDHRLDGHEDDRGHSSSGASMRSLTASRGADGARTLTYDDVANLFKRFQGEVKGTVQYAGALMTLLDVPSWTAAVRKLIKAYKLAGGEKGFQRELATYSDGHENLRATDLSDCFRRVMENHAVAYKDEEVAILVHHFTRALPAEEGVAMSEVLKVCNEELDRQAWMSVSKRFRGVVQKAYVSDIDVEQLLAERDTEGNGTVSSGDFKGFLKDLSSRCGGKLNTDDIYAVANHFSREHAAAKGPTNGGAHQDGTISLQGVMAFLGKDYVGNVTARMRRCVRFPKSGQQERSPEDLLKLLQSYDRSSGKSGGNGSLTLQELETAFSAMGVYDEVSQKQVDQALLQLDPEGRGKVAFLRVFQGLGIPPPEKLKMASGQVDVEAMMRMLLAQVQEKGLPVAEAFRHFDTDGNGSISRDEFEAGLSKLGIFDDSKMKDWRTQIPKLIAKFDKNNDGDLQLSEFLSFLGIKDYAPNVIQRMTKVFAVAAEKGASFDDIFTVFDADGNGNMSATELLSGLQKLGNFDEVTIADAEAIIKQFDKDGDNACSITEFSEYFTSRVQVASDTRTKKKEHKVVMKFCTMMRKAEEKGASLDDIFKHFDKDKGGSVSADELLAGLRKLPHCKSLSDEDIRSLVKSLDADHSGEVSLKEFTDFIEHHVPSSKVETGSIADVGQRVRLVFKKIEAEGVGLAKLFQHLDTDSSGGLSLKEMQAALLKTPHFKSVSAEDVKYFMNRADRNGDGIVSLMEFTAFVHDDSHPGSQSTTQPQRRPHAPKDVFVEQMRRIAQPSGGIEGLMGFLDDDEDGVITKTQFLSMLRREKVFDHISEEQVEGIIAPAALKGAKDTKGLSAVTLLRIAQGQDVGDPPSASPALDDEDDDECKGSAAGSVAVDYDFSVEPETRALEKRLRGLGRTLSKKGLDVEGLFRLYDVRGAGAVRRTEFLEVLSKMGLSILEKGKVMDEAKAAAEDKGAGDARRLQMRQMKRLKGVDASYSNNASKIARKLLMSNGAADEYKYSGDFKEHLESLALIDWYRQGQKRSLLQNVLSHSLSNSVRIYPRFGKTLFFELPLTNPFGHEERFMLNLEDSELRIVTSFDEWIHLRNTCRPCTGELGPEPVELEMFDRDSRGVVQVALLPHETLYVPFTFMTLVPFHGDGTSVRRKQSTKRTAESKSEDSKRDDSSSSGPRSREDDDEEAQRVAEMRVVSCSHGHVVSVYRVHICPRPFLVHRTLRFFEQENGVMRRRIQLRRAPGKLSYPGAYASESRYVHCVEVDSSTPTDANNVTTAGAALQQNRVVVEWGPGSSSDPSASNGGGGVLDILLRYKCGHFPTVGSFFMLIYEDPYQSELHEVWHVVVQSRQRVDLHASIGSVATVDLVVRGDRYARRARAFASQGSDRITFEPKSTFQLIPGAFNRIAVQYSPRLLGSRRCQITLVDSDSKELISAWLMTVTAVAPATTRNYDVDIFPDRPINKKIIFKNPWDTHRRFALVSSDESVMRPRVTVLEVAPYGSAYLRLWFNSYQFGADAREVFLFLNDETGQSEESFSFTIRRRV